MSDYEYILNSLPFYLEVNSPEAASLLNSVPKELWARFNSVYSHEAKIGACDKISDWLVANWRQILPDMAAEQTGIEGLTSADIQTLDNEMVQMGE